MYKENILKIIGCILVIIFVTMIIFLPLFVIPELTEATTWPLLVVMWFVAIILFISFIFITAINDKKLKNQNKILSDNPNLVINRFDKYVNFEQIKNEMNPQILSLLQQTTFANDNQKIFDCYSEIAKELELSFLYNTKEFEGEILS